MSAPLPRTLVTLCSHNSYSSAAIWHPDKTDTFIGPESNF